MNVGLSNNLSIGIGAEFISSFLGMPIWFATPKAAFQISKLFYVGLITVLGIPLKDQLIASSFVHFITTFGNEETNLSLGIGCGGLHNSTGSEEDNLKSSFNLSFIHRVSNGIALITENYIQTLSKDNYIALGIHGIRILGKNNHFDIGRVTIQTPDFSTSSNDNPILLFPYVGYVRTF